MPTPKNCSTHCSDDTSWPRGSHVLAHAGSGIDPQFALDMNSVRREAWKQRKGPEEHLGCGELDCWWDTRQSEMPEKGHGAVEIGPETNDCQKCHCWRLTTHVAANIFQPCQRQTRPAALEDTRRVLGHSSASTPSHAGRELGVQATRNETRMIVACVEGRAHQTRQTLDALASSMSHSKTQLTNGIRWLLMEAAKQRPV